MLILGEADLDLEQALARSMTQTRASPGMFTWIRLDLLAYVHCAIDVCVCVCVCVCVRETYLKASCWRGSKSVRTRPMLHTLLFQMTSQGGSCVFSFSDVTGFGIVFCLRIYLFSILLYSYFTDLEEALQRSLLEF